ncbi:hypothetical protein F5Y15DRAFT_186006 [Xylariaceae sp. FL0016]|nr:hypothetical protein F5Y15DRAFT_186006 [Xylariaceae sp. FL0016]
MLNNGATMQSREHDVESPRRDAGDDSKDADMEAVEVEPVVMSDVIQPRRVTTVQQIPSSVKHGQRHSSIVYPTTTTLQSPSQRTFAVHIRSAPVSPPKNSYHVTTQHFPDESTSMSNRGRPRRLVEQAENGGKAPGALDETLDGETPGQLPPPKKRGRPKGWKAGRDFAVKGDTKPKIKKPQETADGKSRARGRPPRPPDISPRELYLQSEPRYKSYKCEWNRGLPDACHAELYNAHKLYEHIGVHDPYLETFDHKDQDPPRQCRWASCASMDPVPDFTSYGAWDEHIMDKHLWWYFKNLGDGPRNRGIETLEPDNKYLFDKDGKQVTPSVNDQVIETEQEAKDRRKRLKRLLYDQNENTLTEEEYMKQALGMS